MVSRFLQHPAAITDKIGFRRTRRSVNLPPKDAMIGWFRQLDQATSVDEVLRVTREFFATWSPADVARLPHSCRPGRMKGETDLEDLHSAVVEEYRRTKSGGEELHALQRMTSVVVRAAIRMAQLRGSSEDPGAESPAPPSRSAAARSGQ